MTTVVVLVRGINVGRSKRVGMADLRAALVAAGGTEVRTYLQSGNAVLQVPDDQVAAPEDRVRLAVRCEAEVLAGTGVAARVFVRTAEQVRTVAQGNPFPDLVATPKLLHVLFCETQPAADPTGTGLRHGRDELAVGEGCVYVAYRGGSSLDSPLATVLPKIGTVTTARNWTTVEALVRLSS